MGRSRRKKRGGVGGRDEGRAGWQSWPRIGGQSIIKQIHGTLSLPGRVYSKRVCKYGRGI